MENNKTIKNRKNKDSADPGRPGSATPPACDAVKATDSRELEKELSAARNALQRTREQLKDADDRIRRLGQEHSIVTGELRAANQALTESEAKYRSLFTLMSEGFAVHEFIYDDHGRPCDYRFLEINPAFERITGLAAEAIIGRTVREVLPGTEPVWIERFGRVALTGQSDSFESYHAELGRWFEVYAYQTAPSRFAVVFVDASDRKRAEAELEQARKALEHERDLLQQVINGAKNSHLVFLDRDFNFVRVNKAYADACGFTPQEMVGKNHFDLYPHAENEAIFAAVRDSGMPVEFHDKPFIYPDQPERGVTYWTWTLNPVKDALGTVSGFVFSLVETTERKRHEEELRTLNRMLQARSNSAQAMLHQNNEPDLLKEICRIIVEDCDYSKVWVSFAEADEVKTLRPVAQAGFEEGYLESLNLTWADAEYGQGPTGTAIRTGRVDICRDMAASPRMRPWHADVVRFGYSAAIAFPLKAEDTVFGALTIYSQKTDVFSDAEVGLLADLVSDLSYGITAIRMRQAREHAEAALRQSEARFRLLSETAEKLLMTADPHGFAEILCRKVMEHLDCQVFFNFLVAEDAEKLRLNAYAGIPEAEAAKIAWLDYGEAICGCAARDGIPIIAENIPTTLDPRTDRIKSYGIKAYACHPLIAQGRIIGTLSFGAGNRTTFSGEDLALMKTVTFQIATAMERMTLIDDLQESRDELETKVEARTVLLKRINNSLTRSNKALEEFAYVASHDLQEPLRKIQIFADRLKTMPEITDDKAQDYLLRMWKAAARMRRLVQDLLIYSRLTVEHEPFEKINLEVSVAQVLTDLSQLIAETDGHVEFEALPEVYADKSQMEQLFQNLISNALKYHGDRKPVVRIYDASKAAGQFYEIHVKDNGIGFDETYLDKIFKPFQRLHGINDAYRGTGIGLAICRRIAENHGGSVTAKSRPGKGATFIVKLPRERRVVARRTPGAHY